MSEEKSTSTKPTRLVKFQFILFGILLLVFFIWAGGQCSRSQAEIVTDEQLKMQAMVDSLAKLQAATEEHTQNKPRVNDGISRDTIRGGQMQIIRERKTPLFVTIQGLALRGGPGLNHKIIDRLKLYEEVNFLNEVTDSLYTIKLGNITPTEPWVKIRSQKGREGWVYGAGVDFYKRKLEGVE